MSEGKSSSESGMRTVMFWWSTGHGDCWECGLPAAYMAAGGNGPGPSEQKLCAVCAASAAADGETITRISSD